MDRRDLLGGVFWLAISVVVGFLSLRNEFGAFQSPGPAFFPFLSAVALGALAVILLITGSVKKAAERKIADLWKGLEWKRVGQILFSLFLYPWVLPLLGYLMATFGLMAFLFGILGRTRTWVRVLGAFIVTLASYFIFYRLLDVRLPKRILGL